MKRLLLALLVLLAALGVRADSAALVGTVVVTTADQGGLRKYSLAWVSDASGNVSGNFFAVRAGTLVSVRFEPGAGSLAPDDNYDVTLVDRGLFDVLGGVGANRDTANVESAQWEPEYYQDGSSQLDLRIANAGNANAGTVIFFVRLQ